MTKLGDVVAKIRNLGIIQKNLALVVFAVFSYTLALVFSYAVRTHQTSLSSANWGALIPFCLWLLTYAFLERILRHNLPGRNVPILPLMAFLTGIGVMTIWRLQPYLGLRQGFLLLLCIPVCHLVTTKQIPVEELLKRYYGILLIGALLLTGLTIFLGIYPSGVGPQLWLRIGGLIFQPSEILKPTIIIFLAGYFSAQPFGHSSTKKLILLSILFVVSAGAFFIIQRDLGTAAIIVMIFTFMLVHFVQRRRIFIIGIIAAMIALFLGDNFIPLVHMRINTWLNPWVDSADSSYQIVQSLVAMAEGGMWGTGPGLGSPSLIPLAHSDFIFSAIAEETGWIGSFMLLSASFLITYMGLNTAKKQQHMFNKLAIAGIACFFGIQTILIAGGNAKFLPLTGVTFPLVSAGGSSLLTTMFSLFLMIRLDSNQTTPQSIDHPTKKTNVYVFSQMLFFIAFGSILMYELNWSAIQKKELSLRSDNLRPLIADRFSPRGSILDRSGEIIIYTDGKPGAYSRYSTEPSTGHLFGYSDLAYGQSGIEYYQNSHLRGIQTERHIVRWVNDILFNQPPGNNSLQTTIDVGLQHGIDQLLSDRTGAVIVMNPKTGELLAVYSTPKIDTNRIDELMDDWKEDPSAPLLNRAMMGQYAPGTALSPILLAELFEQNLELPFLPESYLLFFDNNRWECADTGIIAYRWSDALKAGCPSPLLAITQRISTLTPLNVFEKIGLSQTVPVPIEQLELETFPSEFSSQDDDAWQKIILGIPDFQITPLQMADMLARFYQEGIYLPPSYIYAPMKEITSTTNSNPATQSNIIFYSPSSINKVFDLLRDQQYPGTWNALGTALSGKTRITWWLGGTHLTEIESPRLVVLVLEEDNAPFAAESGKKILQNAINNVYAK